ncbi:unnamed protein product, partial [Mesorhabditis belari]|uniref:Peptidase M12A domain-containing protein n=1 Tax=Mesorhabditis belari TaxID=2138241 RepID=A0AAF3FGG9_9BILA
MKDLDRLLPLAAALFLICSSSVILSESESEPEVAFLSDEDFINADRLAKDEIEKKEMIPIEAVNGYRSDIRGPWAERVRHKRNGVSRVAKLWPNARIPYAISPHYSTHERALLARAVKAYHEKTCIRFVPRAGGEADYLFYWEGGWLFFGSGSNIGRASAFIG